MKTENIEVKKKTTQIVSVGIQNTENNLLLSSSEGEIHSNV